MKNVFRFIIITLVSFLVYQLFCQAEESQKKYEYKRWKFLYEEKCSKCHTLDRVFADLKTEEEWRACIARMMRKNPLWITPEDSEQIIQELFNVREDIISKLPMKKRYENARLLFIDRCTKCHQLDRILNEDKTREEWEETVLRMRDNAPELFYHGDVKIIVDFLAERSHIMKEDVGAEIIVNKCLICHEWGRILLEEKTKKGWEECVTRMRKIVRKEMKKDWFTHDEFKLVVELLEKTQGIEKKSG